jgi:hypothetical protein
MIAAHSLTIASLSSQEVSLLFQLNLLGITTGCGTSFVSTIYFVSFYVVVPLIFLNLFIAIILEGFTSTNNSMSSLLQDDDIDKFIDLWARFDVTVRTSLFLNLIRVRAF